MTEELEMIWNEVEIRIESLQDIRVECCRY
jgi:hypothetical protein